MLLCLVAVLVIPIQIYRLIGETVLCVSLTFSIVLITYPHQLSVVGWRFSLPMLSPPWLKSEGVVMVVNNDFQPHPCLSILHTNVLTLEGLTWCELPISDGTHTIWVQKGGFDQAKYVPSQAWKIGCGDHFSAHRPISTLSNHSLYLLWKIGWVELIWNGWFGVYTLNQGVKRRDPSQNFHHRWLKSQGVVMVVGCQFQSPPSLTIHYTYIDTLEGLGCCELPE